MEVSEIEAVLGFLRKNGLAEAESAFKVDIDERKDLGSFDLEKFEFPMSPSLPPLRIATRSEVGNGCFDGGSSNSEDFVSMGSSSSTTNGSLSGFINPYGITSRIRTKSDASSDRLSEFGTARDYHDSDLFNNMYWFDEKDGDYLKYPSLEGPDFLTCTTSEDKFVTTLETKDPFEEPSGLNFASEGFHSVTSIGCLDKPCLLTDTSIDYVEDAPVKDCNHWDEMVQPEQSSEAGLESHGHGRDCHCSLPQYDSSTALEEFHGNNSENLHLVDTMNEPNMTASQSKRVGEVPFEFNFETISENSMSGNSIHYAERKSTNKVGKEDVNEETDLHLVAENSFLPFRDESYETEDSKEKDGTPQESDIAGDGEECSTPNELQMYQSCEDDYEVFNLRIVHRKNRTGFEENKDLPIVLNAVIAGRYYVTEYIGSAAFSKVVQAHDLHTGVDVCLKIIKNDKEFFDQSLDEIKLLKFVNKHDPADKHHILRLYDYFYHREHLFIVCELLRANLYEFQKYNQDSGGETYFTLRRIQMITRQCLEALEYLHHLGIIHCDLKPENILIKSYSRCEVKVIDLGSSCFQTDNLCLYVQSRSYRAPEVILGCSYDQKIDIWSLGCILAELYSGDVLFPNDGLVLLLARMTAMFGPIDMEMLVEGQETHKYFTEEYELYHLNEETNQLEYIIPEESSLEHHLQASDIGFIEFIKLLLETNPKRRPTASEALQHPWLSYPYA